LAYRRASSHGRLVFGIFASVAEFERELVRGRVVSGLAAAKARGQRLGRPTIPVNVAQIDRLRSEGLSWAAIGKELGMGESTARRAGGASAKNPISTVSVSRLVA
jgi:DNA invertase Pin-like site-specific DNA recombinase